MVEQIALAQVFDENKNAALKGGTAAGKALAAFEESIGKKVVTSENFKLQIKEAKLLQRRHGKIKPKFNLFKSAGSST